MEIVERRVLSSDGVHELIGKVYIPEGEPIGLFQVVHGMIEHIGRRGYDLFMREIAEKGFVVFGYDHLGHGKTAEADGSHGYIAKKDGWKLLIDDVAVFGNAMKKEFGAALPYILMGHSMGSFIVRLTAQYHPGLCDKLIIMGTGGPNPAAGVGLALIGLLKLFKGDKGYSNLIDGIAFGSYNKRFADENDIKSWLTKDKETRSEYKTDPFCSFRFTLSAMGDLIRLNRNCNSKKWASSLRKDLPILLVSGCEDPVGDYGKGVTKVYEMLKNAGANADMKLYPDCRHEILNDTCRSDVMADISAFIK